GAVMKLATYVQSGQPHLGCVDADRRRIYPIAENTRDGAHAMLDWIRAHPEDGAAFSTDGVVPLDLDQVTIQAPIPLPARNIMCVGKNYLAHADEFARSGYDRSDSGGATSRPEAPIIFTKAPSSVIGPEATVIYPHGL